MKTAPITPARIVFAANEPPRAAHHGGVYHPAIGAGAQARHVFLQGNQLPQRWAGRGQFTVLEIGFGLGNNFLATWQAWRDDPERCARLHVVSLELHPPTRDDLARAHAAAPPEVRPLIDALLCAWPPLTPNLHALDFDGGSVQLLLALGDAVQLLPALQLQADAFYLDGFAPALNPQLWQPRLLKALARKAAPGATLATWCATGALRHGLRSAGFAVQRAAGIGGKWENTLATYAPAFQPRRPGAVECGAPASVATEPGAAGGSATAAAVTTPMPAIKTAIKTAITTAIPTAIPTALTTSTTTASTPAARLPAQRIAAHDAVVVGAGIAGAAVAQALALQGLRVMVCEGHSRPAQETSGNPAGLFHGSVHAGDGSYARLYRAAALHAQRLYGRALRGDSGVAGSTGGLLRRAGAPGDLAALQAVVLGLGLPPDHVAVVDAATAARLAGAALPAAAWFHYPGGGWIAPQEWVRHALTAPGVAFSGGCAVGSLQRDGSNWLLRDACGAPAAAAPIVVLANAAAAAPLLAPLGHAAWPLHHSRGQVTFWSAEHADPAVPHLLLPVAGDGYAVPLPLSSTLPDGGLLCGATRDIEPPPVHQAADHAQIRLQDHRHNIDRLQRLTGITAPQDVGACQGRVGWRLHAADNLPLAGALPLARMPPGQRLDQARLLPREAGLFVITALGARGLTLAPLLARLVAAQATGTPWPLEQDLADAVDPARWLVRRWRAEHGPEGARAAAVAVGAGQQPVTVHGAAKAAAG